MDIISWVIASILDAILLAFSHLLPVGLDAILQPLESWHWLLIGLALLSIELLISGAYFLWIGAAALAAGMVSYLIPLHPIAQVILFGMLAILLVWGSRKLLPRYHIKPTDVLLNRRGAQLIGRELILDEPICQGRAQVQIGDSKWMVHGPDLPAREKVVVVRVEGVILIVEHVSDLVTLS